MSSTSQSSDSFDSAFAELREKVAPLDRGLVAGMRRLFRPKIKDPELLSHLLRLIDEFKYWKYLRQLLICVHKCSNADEVVKNWGSLVIKIEAALNEIAEDFRVVCEDDYILKSSWEALDVLRGSERKIGVFKLETAEALDHLSNSCRSIEWRLPLLARSLCSEFLISSISILECSVFERNDDFKKNDGGLRLLVNSFKGFIISPLEYFLQTAIQDVESGLHSNHVIDNLCTHIAFLALRIANQSFHYWINKMLDPVVARSKMIGLLDLLCEIDPLNPQFLDLILKYLRALNRINPDRAKESVSSFICKILRRDLNIKRKLPMKLEPLILFDIINDSEELPCEDVQSLMAEIKVMLMLVGVFHRGVSNNRLSSLELDTRICLLNAEVFLKRQLNSSIISLMGKDEELNELLEYLRTFSDQPQQEIENEKQTFMLIDEVARELASLYLSFHEKKITQDRVISLLLLLLKVVIFKADSSCVGFLKYLNGNASTMGVWKDQMETLFEGLNLFENLVTNQHKEITKDLELIFTNIETNARGITSLYYSHVEASGRAIVHDYDHLYVNKITEEMIEKMIFPLLDKMTLIKAKLREICPQFPRSNFPKSHGIGFIDFFLENLSELLKHCPDSIALVKHHIEKIQLDLESLKSSLLNLDSKHLELKNGVTEVAYEADYIIDSIEVGLGDHWQHLLWLHDLCEEISFIKVQAAKIHDEKACVAKVFSVVQSSSHKISQVITSEMGENMVCLSKEEDAIIDRLTRGSSQRDVISIVGMPGIGKTTLAKKVYNDPKVTYHFHIRGWCSVSQGYGKRDMLLNILSIISGLGDDIHQMTDEDLDLKLYQTLKQKRYLIVMDDVWDDGAWNALEKSFPNDGNGSRILMTSRVRDVVLNAKPDSDPYSLRLLSDDESWKLLQMKIFHGGCPDELLEVGKEIAKNCKGLPLAIVAIAGLLERTEKKQERWKNIAESLSSRIVNDPQTRCMDILQLSYSDLPDCLKACFLYFGAFLEDKDIPVCKLIRLWIAEGFIRKTVLKSLEDLAEDYLTDLIGRSLVTVSRKGSRGRVRACRIHDLLRDLCLSKAKEENFLQLITVNDEPYSSLSDLGYGADFYDYYPSNPVTYERHRICFCLRRNHFVKSSPCGPCTRSLMFFALSDTYPRRPYDISFIPRHFKLLRVLDLEDINMGICFPTGIELLVQLRYLAVSGDIDFIPPAIANLRKLETLTVKGLKGMVILHDSIWCMTSLRHFHVNDHVDFNLQDDKLKSSFYLDNLVSFSSPSLSCHKDAENIMRRFPNLRKLRCIFLESWDPSRNYNKFPELNFLIQLESLNVFYIGRFLNPGEFTLPRNLKKLTLSNFRLPWTHISTIGRLENLEVLKILSRAFEGRIWDMNEGEFLGLKYLKLDTLNIARWNASNDHLPNLQQLVLQNCKDLEEVPYAFVEIPTLQMIEVQSCGRCTEESVRNIGEEGIEGLKIIINHKIHI